MRVLLLGGSGLLSGATLRAFLHMGHDVSVLTRGERALPAHERLTRLRADRTNAAELAGTLGGQRFDFAADFLAFDGSDVDRLLAVPGFDPGRLAADSSGKGRLARAWPRRPFRERDANQPLMREPASHTRDHGQWAYGMGKRAVEAALARARAANGLSALALRLPVVQGEEDRVGS